MSDWEEVKLEDVIELHDSRRIPLSTRERSKRQGKYPYYGASGIIDYIDDYIYEGRYLLVAEDGENLRSRKLPVAFFAKGKFWVNNHAHVIRGKENVLDDVFLKGYLNNLDFSPYITGTAQPKLSQKNLCVIPINLPPIEEQRKIAAVLSKYDDLIEANQRQIDDLEAAAQSLYREWFVEFRFPGHEDVPMVATDEGDVPKGWELVPLKKLAKRRRDTVKPEEIPDDTPYVGLGHIPQHTIKLDDWGEVGDTKSRKRVFKQGDILFAKIRPYLHKVVFAPLDGVSSTDAIVIVPQDKFYWIVLMLVSSDIFIAHAAKTSKGTQMPRADWKILQKYLVPIPPDDLLEQFNQFISDIVAKIHNYIFMNAELRDARDKLLPKLVSGAVRVDSLDVW